MSDQWIEIIVPFSLAFIVIAIVVALILRAIKSESHQGIWLSQSSIPGFIVSPCGLSAYYLLVDHLFPAHCILQSGL